MNFTVDDSEALITTSDDDPYNIKALANQGRFKEILEIKVINESIDQATNGLSCLNCNSRCGLEFSVVNHLKMIYRRSLKIAHHIRIMHGLLQMKPIKGLKSEKLICSKQTV